MENKQTIQELLQELEMDQALKKAEIYKSFVYQPERLSISSQNATSITASDQNPSQNDNSYYNFNINLPRPLLNVKSLQLLRASIPQCSPSIQDTALVFYYYRIPTQLDINGDPYYTELPNINNLYCVRLLPSYYKQELIDTPSQYGFNQTFNSYEELLTQLNLATINDLAYNNQIIKTMPFISGDITFSLHNNKFQMTGNNVNTPSFPDWNGTWYYKINDVVIYLGNRYISISDYNSGRNPITQTAYWQPYTQTNNFNTYLAAGYQDPNVLTLQQYKYNTSWNPYSRYYQDQIVYYNGRQYQAKWNVPSGVMPPEPRFWAPLSSTDPITALGINGFSQTYDFELLAGIPGQPFLAPPLTNRTLNLIMGFTWNGLNYQLAQLITPTTYLAGSPAPLFFNRLRPIPVYASLGGGGGGLGAYPQTTTATYSADAYCNLVFSSIVSVYCSIVAAATLDTQRNNNLLAIIPMNCPNLGVTFYNNVINNELTKVNNDIYTLYIELRAEDGSPYLISNNGIISLDLKLTY